MTVTRVVGISGMQKIGDNTFLVVHDTFATQPPHLGVLEVRPHAHKPRVGYTCEDVELSGWPEGLHKPNDLEGICAVPCYESEYLIAESGFYPKYGDFGRIFRVRLGKTEAGWNARYVGRFEPFPPPANSGETPKDEQIEGIDCLSYAGQVVLLIARRGHKTKPASLLWGHLTELDTANPRFTCLGCHTLSPDVVADRGAADLYTQSVGPGVWEIWSVASVDSGDVGPFRSSIYSAGRFEITSGNEPRFSPYEECEVLWDLEGLKVEALAPAAALVPDSALSIATDDEDYWGIWRPILPSRGKSHFTDQLLMEKVRGL